MEKKITMMRKGCNKGLCMRRLRKMGKERTNSGSAYGEESDGESHGLLKVQASRMDTVPGENDLSFFCQSTR